MPAHQLRYYEAQGLLTPARAALRQRRSKLDRQIDTLPRSREALDSYIRVTELNTGSLAPSTYATR
ncbi:MerR family transcriptional regulator [Streptomyces cyaneochromogenes]|uniref:MerR family transcriptional regulator n=1 Tax=Streptomyces cyaneochromogenes TaxID=2496836 RepID=UPI001E455885|nr:MerR family transcriptional regulator [Streptomyces cyaneochromogenes]